ncbi:copper chaperone CopZ [Shouchella lonarensis]|uniref:Copper chaperone CopZ n=1 Tax=Shouchella lonarensis TaxID=1464122 RepID=A0A1G6IGY4_9BACI|nr:copper chaperone CopZ [Shouchella lonarensis]SDC05653.1 copper chaperone [Shouchella lonarensis]
MAATTVQVEGMSCGHCVAAIEKAVGGLTGVTQVHVSLEDKTVAVTYNEQETNIQSIQEMIEDQGYDVQDDTGCGCC